MSRLTYLFGAVACFIMAAALIFITGLPDRAEYTGYLNVQGQRVAPEIGAFAPDFDALSIQDEAVSLSGLRGTPVVINFWATWCGPCVEEMPQLEQVYQEYAGNSLRILAVNLGETKEQITAWSQRFDLSYDLLLDEDQSIRDVYRVFGPPSTYVISPQGTITHIFYGPITASELQRIIAPLLG